MSAESKDASSEAVLVFSGPGQQHMEQRAVFVSRESQVRGRVAPPIGKWDLGRLYQVYGIILVALIYSSWGTVHFRDCNTYTGSWRQTVWFWLSTIFQFLELVCSDLGQQEERLQPTTPATPRLRPTCSFEAKPYEDIIILVSFQFETSWKKIK